jgi:hypothetical protein
MPAAVNPDGNWAVPEDPKVWSTLPSLSSLTSALPSTRMCPSPVSSTLSLTGVILDRSSKGTGDGANPPTPESTT